MNSVNMSIDFFNQYGANHRLGDIICSSGYHQIEKCWIFFSTLPKIRGAKVSIQAVFKAINKWTSKNKGVELISIIGFGSAFRDPPKTTIQTHITKGYLWWKKTKTYCEDVFQPVDVHDVDFLVLVNKVPNQKDKTIYKRLPEYASAGSYGSLGSILDESGIHILVSSIDELKKDYMYDEIVRDGVLLVGSFPERLNGKKCIWSVNKYLSAVVV